MIATEAQALALVRRHRVVTLTPAAEGVPSLVGEIVGGPVQGSWWGHPKGGLIYALGEALADAPDVLVLKLVAGKVSYLHRALWAALYRYAADEARRAAASARLSREARGLLEAVERAGLLRLERAAQKKPAAELVRPLLCLSGSVHTEKGSHATVLRSLARWAAPEVKAEAAELSLEEAAAALRAACGGARLP